MSSEGRRIWDGIDRIKQQAAAANTGWSNPTGREMAMISIPILVSFCWLFA